MNLQKGCRGSPNRSASASSRRVVGSLMKKNGRGSSKNPAEWLGRGPETRSRSGRGDAAEVRSSQFARRRYVPSTSANLLLMGGRKHFIEVVTDHRVAFTRDLFERRAIDDVDETAAVTDESCALQQAGRDRHRGAAHAKHLAEKLLRQRDRVAVDAIVRLQQPAAKPGLERMERIARDRLLDLRQQQIVVAHDEVANGLALVRSRMKLSSREPRGRARQLNDRSAEGPSCA